MLRSILVALDDTRASETAQEVAIALARRSRAEITGLAILDRPHITAPTAVGIGGLAYKTHRDQVKLEQAKTFLARLERRFEASCENLDVIWRVIEVEGVPYELIEQESGRHDLVVIGKDTDFHQDEHPAVADMVHRLLHENPRPMIVCPAVTPTDGGIIAATDGSVRSMRALHMLALLGSGQGWRVRVVAAASGQHEADRRAHDAGELLAKHGFEVETRGVATRREPSEILIDEAKSAGAGMIAVGASGYSAIHDFFLGSTSRRLIESAPCPLFLHH